MKKSWHENCMHENENMKFSRMRMTDVIMNMIWHDLSDIIEYLS